MQASSERFAVAGRTALVTGGNRGLGKVFARALAEAGAQVMISASDAESLARTGDEFASDGLLVKTAAADLRHRSDVQLLAETANEALGHVDILVANAGVAEATPVASFSSEAMDKLIEVNLLAPMLLTRLLAQGMTERRWGRLIYISSVAAFVSSETDGHGVYSATKAGLNGFMRTAAIELGKHGITANSIAPGTFLTDMARTYLETYGEAGQASYDKHARMNALYRWGEPEELVGPLLLLASNAGSFITGSVLIVDGGFTVRSTPAQ